jgi:hypothetical protein
LPDALICVDLSNVHCLLCLAEQYIWLATAVAMKKGFFSTHATHQAGDNRIAAAASRPAAAAAAAAAVDPTADIPQQQPAQPFEPAGAHAQAAARDVRNSTNWQQCLELLRSDVDEKK